MKRMLVLVLALLGWCAAASAETTLWPASDPETGLWGYIDAQGAWGIEPRYERAYHFHGGCAIVDMTEHAHANTPSQGVIDETGAFLLEPEYLVDDVVCWDEGAIYLVWRREDEEFRMGWFSIPNRYFSGLNWTECYVWCDTPYILVSDEYALNGLAERATGKVVVPLEYSSTGLYDWGIDQGFVVADRKGPAGCELIEIGKGVVSLPEGVYVDYGAEVSEGMVPYYTEEGLWGYLNTAGDIVIEVQFDWVSSFVDGYAQVGFLEDDEISAIINRLGQVVISGIKDHGYDGYQGMIDGALWIDWSEDFWCLVEPDGTVRCHHAYPEGMYSEWLYEVADDGPLWLCYTIGDGSCRYGLMARSGEMIVEPCWMLSGDRLSNDAYGWQAVALEGKWGYVDAYGEVVIPYQYAYAEHFDGALALVQDADGSNIYITRAGEVVYQWTEAPAPQTGD
ncbi:MAG: WG repeat-containing protein [Clostridia bacterium]|nr:WG repeat-containing protein [Clostridia bacterium]